MMEEVSMTMAYDADTMEQMSEEEILACLVEETGPQFTVPSKKAELKESRLQLIDDEEPLDKYLKENYVLQQTSLRLEQENDSLAHRLITSKIALKNALDQAEDRVDELTKDLLQTRHHLQTTEEEKRGKEEEAEVAKEVFRRELQKTEQEVRRSSGVIADYKQICSQLTSRLERQQAAHREELDSLKSAVKACSHCQHLVESDAVIEGHGNTEPGQEEDDTSPKKEEQRRVEKEKESLRAEVKELEQELAKTKVHMVESKCKIQELEHQKGILANDLQEAKNSWISKAFTSLRTPSAGGLHSISLPREGAPSVVWNLRRGSLSEWSAKKLSWPHRNKQEHL